VIIALSTLMQNGIGTGYAVVMLWDDDLKFRPDFYLLGVASLRGCGRCWYNCLSSLARPLAKWESMRRFLFMPATLSFFP
jgi:hypothetical protein